MRMSMLFGRTLRETPADAEMISHQLLLRAGMIRPLGTGVYSYLPLGYRVKAKVEAILRTEMDAIGAQEMLMPVVHPAEIWQASGRWHSNPSTCGSTPPTAPYFSESSSRSSTGMFSTSPLGHRARRTAPSASALPRHSWPSTIEG